MAVEANAPIPNPYLAALRRARGAVAPRAVDLRGELTRARASMDAGAWVSSTADGFYDELVGHAATLGRAADEAVDVVDGAIRGRTEMVDPDSRDGRWRG